MVAQRQNFVNAVADTAGIQFQNVIGSVSKPGAIAEYANNCVANADMICRVADNVQQKAEQQDSRPSTSLDIQTPSIAWSAVGAGAILALSVINPALGAGAAVIGAVGEAMSFATGHAGVKGSMPQGGELTIAAADKKSYAEHGGSSTYLDTQGDTYSVSTGQKQAAVAPQMSTMDQKIASATQEVSGKYSQDQIAGDVKSMLEKQQKDYAWAQNKLDLMGIKGTDVTADLDMDRMDMAAPKKPLKALNVGMGAPSGPGGMG